MLSMRRDPYGDLWAEFNRMSDEVNRLFSSRPHAAGGLPLSLWADDHNLYVELDLPAVDPDRFEITVTEGTQLTVAGERPAPDIPDAVWVRQERPFGKFARTVDLPVLVDPDRVEAKYEHGVLRLTLPKSEAAKPRKITVTA